MEVSRSVDHGGWRPDHPGNLQRRTRCTLQCSVYGVSMPPAENHQDRPGGASRPTKLGRKARHLHFKPFHFADDGIFLDLQPEPHLDEREASERER